MNNIWKERIVMNIKITSKELDATDAIKDYIEKKAERLVKYFGEDFNVYATIKTEGNSKVAEISIKADSDECRAVTAHKDLYAAIDKDIDILEGQIRKIKTKKDKQNMTESIRIKEGANLEYTEVSNEIRSDFGMPFWWGSDALMLGRKLSDLFCKKLSDDDIKSFISETGNFKYSGFLRFLQQKCEQHQLDVMERIPPELEVQIVPLIFDDVLRLVSASIVDRVRQYCNQVLESMLS